MPWRLCTASRSSYLENTFSGHVVLSRGVITWCYHVLFSQYNVVLSRDQVVCSTKWEIDKSNFLVTGAQDRSRFL